MKLLARVSLLCNPGAFVTVKARLPLAIACFRHSVSWGPRGEGGGGVALKGSLGGGVAPSPSNSDSFV